MNYNINFKALSKEIDILFGNNPNLIFNNLEEVKEFLEDEVQDFIEESYNCGNFLDVVEDEELDKLYSLIDRKAKKFYKEQEKKNG